MSKAINLLDACQSMAASFESTGSVEHFKKKSKAEKTAKKTAKKTERKEKLAGFKDKLAQGVEKIGVIATVAPFRKIMLEQLNAKKILNEKGKPFSKDDDLKEIAASFYEEVVRKGKTKNFVLTAEVIGGIVSGIISFFKGLKKKKEEGATLSAAEEKMLTGAEKVGAAAEEVERDYTEEGIGELLMKYWWVLAAVGLLFILKK